jgi:hypothetical protein
MIGKQWKLVNRPVRVQDPPACPVHKFANLRKPLPAVKRLVVFSAWMANQRIEFIKTHEIRVVGRRQE